MPSKFMIRDHPADIGGKPSGATGWHQSDVCVNQVTGAVFPSNAENYDTTSVIRFSNSGNPLTGNNFVKVRIRNIGDDPADDSEKLNPANVQVRIFSPGRTQFNYPTDYESTQSLIAPVVIKPILEGSTSFIDLKSGQETVLSFQIDDSQLQAMHSLGNWHFCMIAGILYGTTDDDAGSAPNGVGLPSPGYMGNTWDYRKLAQRNLDLIEVI